MLTTLALLPLAAVTVTGVTSENRDNNLTIEVATSEPMPAHAVRPMSGHRLVYLFVNDATPAQDVFENGDHPVVARTRPRYTKLEIPIDPGVRCHEPAAVRALPTGFRVQFSCGSNAGIAAAVDEPEPRAPGRQREVKAPHRGASQELLQAALTLPAEMPFAAKSEGEEDENPEAKPSVQDQSDRKAADSPVAPAVVASAHAKATGSDERIAPDAAQPTLALAKTMEPPRSKGTAKASEKSARAEVLTPPPVVADPAAAASPPPAPAEGHHLASSWVLAVVVLLGLGGGVLALTRKRARRQNLIEILETAAIGPKRALLVARVNGQIMVLGASEAGIALLGPVGGEIESPIAAVMGSPPPLRGQPEKFAAPSESAAAPEPDGEVGVLSRLFRLRPKQSSSRDVAAFRELLDESYEDQELRDKLAQGLSGKVS
jgi:flagellar biogenesis protein FliO